LCIFLKIELQIFKADTTLLST